MQISQITLNNFEIKTKGAVITASSNSKINDITLLGTGEYEIAGIEVFGVTNEIYYFRVEEIGVAYIGVLEHQLTDAEYEQLATASILILLVDSGSDANATKLAQSTIKSIDPKIIIPVSTDTTNFCKIVGGCEEPIASYKITKPQLALMERQTYLLLKPNK